MASAHPANSAPTPLNPPPPAVHTALASLEIEDLLVGRRCPAARYLAASSEGEGGGSCAKGVHAPASTRWHPTTATNTHPPTRPPTPVPPRCRRVGGGGAHAWRRRLGSSAQRRRLLRCAGEPAVEPGQPDRVTQPVAQPQYRRVGCAGTWCRLGLTFLLHQLYAVPSCVAPALPRATDTHPLPPPPRAPTRAGPQTPAGGSTPAARDLAEFTLKLRSPGGPEWEGVDTSLDVSLRWVEGVARLLSACWAAWPHRTATAPPAPLHWCAARCTFIAIAPQWPPSSKWVWTSVPPPLQPSAASRRPRQLAPAGARQRRRPAGSRASPGQPQRRRQGRSRRRLGPLGPRRSPPPRSQLSCWLAEAAAAESAPCSA